MTRTTEMQDPESAMSNRTGAIRLAAVARRLIPGSAAVAIGCFGSLKALPTVAAIGRFGAARALSTAEAIRRFDAAGALSAVRMLSTAVATGGRDAVKALSSGGAVGRLDGVKVLAARALGEIRQRAALLPGGERLFGQPAPEDEPAHPLVQEVEALGAEQERQLAYGVAVLWDEFLTTMGGPVAYAARSESDRAEYVGGLRRSADQVRLKAGSERMHYALAPDLLASYVEVLAKTEHSAQERALAGAVARLATQGHVLRKQAQAPRAQSPAAAKQPL